MQFAVRLPSSPAAVPLARRAIERAEGHVDEDVLGKARLLVSELVTNSVRHVPGDVAGEIELAVAYEDEVLRVEVRDRGPGFAVHARVPGQDLGSGWGLHFLSTLSSRWGVETDADTRVWFELDAAGDRAGHAAV